MLGAPLAFGADTSSRYSRLPVTAYYAMSTDEKHVQNTSVDEVDEKGQDKQESTSQDGSEIDLVSYHEHNAGRLVVDPE